MTDRPMVQLVNERQAAAALGMSAGALKEGRLSGRLGIPWIRVGVRGVRYDVGDLAAYRDQRRIVPTEAPDATA